MPILESILKFLDYQIETPKLFGAFHIICLILSVGVGILLCVLYYRGIIRDIRRVILVTAIIVLVFEVYKQINYSFSYDDGIKFSYQWYAFPWQFCSTPLYIGLLAGLTRGKIHDFFCSYLATYALFAGTAVMIYPGDVFTSTLGISIQTMICHGSMITIAIFLYYTQHVETTWSTLLKAVPIFSITMTVAVILNELAHLVGITADHNFNMFYVSRHKESTLPVYSLVHNAIMEENPSLYPLCLVIYIIGFTICAAAMLLLARGVEYVATMDYDAQYAEMDARRRERRRRRQERLAILEAERRQKLAENRERRQQEREEKRELREIQRDEKRSERQREKARRKQLKKEQRKEKRRQKKLAKQEARKQKKLQKQKERQEERRLEKRMRDIEKREKQEAKARKKAEKRRKRLEKDEKKAYKKWLKKQKKLGNDEPDIQEFYAWYYGEY